MDITMELGTNNFFLNSKSVCLLVLHLMVCVVYCQSTSVKIDIIKRHDCDIEKLFCPKIETKKTKEFLFFSAKPSFVEPEHSIRIISNGNQLFLEARFLDKNFRNELFRLKQQLKEDSLSLKMYYFSVPISVSFKNRMLKAFSKIIAWQVIKTKANPNPQLFDGTSYEFRINDNGEISSVVVNDEFKYSDLGDRVAAANLQIINDLKNNRFKESSYKAYNEL